ncbi:type II secretion system F family protein [uncultured Oscillibacter sp.]|uniref:type II secretion system F family protein n=1 Tax=uncultured Oscillibacter sp. TaxID=876091 RepID=UPI0025E554E9|nr:type II secretion system F family protein [uncultured Oscillibacter sp.]
MAKSKPPKAEAKKKELLPAQLENPLKTMMPNYRTYEMSALEKASAALLAFLAGAVCSQVFYGGLFKSDGQATVMTYISAAVFILIVGAAAVKLFLPVRREQLRKKRQHELGVQFRDMLESITTSLSAGDTVYQAFESAWSDIRLQYGESSYLALELEQIVQAPRSGLTLETMLKDFAGRSGSEDIESFSNVFAVSYGAGGNMKDVMRRTHDIITDKMAITDEIRTKLSANKLELNVITVAPVFLMLLLRSTNESFAEKFASPGGVVCITIAIVIFASAFRMGRRIVEIEEG